ncbi:MAG: FtsW/RodA/SpoVE family cell cycle protein [Anaerolineales bacterium]|nr:FtsW/RodA/SpoVE family cell cycle protein [Anaerolineales bacterium]
MSNAIQTRLLRWIGVFLCLYSVILTLAPAVRERSWDVDYRFAHWIGFLIWLLAMRAMHSATVKHLQDHDPYLFSAAALLAGWGLLTVWRLNGGFGFKQALWLIVSAAAFLSLIRFRQHFMLLRQYKYILLFSGLILTALTILLGTNPLNAGPRLWLGCCGVYFQPSEPLKLLLVIYLSAYLADRPFIKLNSLPLLIPTIALTGFVLLLLFFQRDLGTASIFVFIFTIMLFIATGKKRILVASGLVLVGSLLAGYFLIDVIHIRINAWLYPWADPSGQSYQIVQSILAVASGGALGRGPGMGSPTLVPVAISDFIFAAIAEETGLLGTLGLLATIWLFLARGLLAALHAPDRFRRFLATGIVTYLGIQSLLIIGGNIRVAPLTGVTLPFVSYGGSSLLTAFIALALLLIISAAEDSEPAPLKNYKPYALLSTILAGGLIACAFSAGWWALVRGPDLVNRTDNARRTIADRYVLRGSLLDRNNTPLNVTQGKSGSYERIYLYPPLGPTLGYTHPIFGQAGLEASLDDYLRGLQGNPSRLIWWDHLVYGSPPSGLDVRLSLDLNLQKKADELLNGHIGAIVLINAQTGEILSMASSPTFDANQLNEIGSALSSDPTAPLLNRVTQGLYPLGDGLLPLIQTQYSQNTRPSNAQIQALLTAIHLFEQPKLNLPLAQTEPQINVKDVRVTPLQVVLAISALSNHGVVPAPRISMAVNTPEQGWVTLPAQGTAHTALPAAAADEAALDFIVPGTAYWSHINKVEVGEKNFTWLVSGSLPNWGGSPLALAAILEEDNAPLARAIRDQLLGAIIK